MGPLPSMRGGLRLMSVRRTSSARATFSESGRCRWTSTLGHQFDGVFVTPSRELFAPLGASDAPDLLRNNDLELG